VEIKRVQRLDDGGGDVFLLALRDVAEAQGKKHMAADER